MWMGGLSIWIQKQIVVARVACSCVLERSKFCTLGQGVWQLILNAGNPLEGNPVTLRYFMGAGLSLFCAVPRVFSSLLPCIPSLPAVLRLLGPRVVPPGCAACARQGEPARSAAAPLLGPSLSIRLLPFYALPKGCPASSALETSWGQCRLPALPAHSLFYFFPFSFFFFFPPFFNLPWPHGVTLSGFWRVTGSTRESA